MNKCRSLVKLLVDEIRHGKIELVESNEYSQLQKKYSKLGVGELSVIASAKHKIAFIEDRDAENAAWDEGVKVYNIPEVLLAGKMTGKFKNTEISKIINDLREKDGYVFKKAIEKELVK